MSSQTLQIEKTAQNERGAVILTESSQLKIFLFLFQQIMKQWEI